MTTQINVGDENLAHQIVDAMDAIRAEVWQDHNVLGLLTQAD